MAAIITVEDLAAFGEFDQARAEAMVADAVAMAVMVAPCLADASDEKVLAAAKAIVRRAILRWSESGSAGTRTVHQQTAGPFSESATVEATGSRGLFFPSEIASLQNLCRLVASGAAFTIDMTGLPKSPNPLQGVVINGPSEGGLLS